MSAALHSERPLASFMREKCCYDWPTNEMIRSVGRQTPTTVHRISNHALTAQLLFCSVPTATVLLALLLEQEVKRWFKKHLTYLVTTVCHFANVSVVLGPSVIQ